MRAEAISGVGWWGRGAAATELTSDSMEATNAALKDALASTKVLQRGLPCSPCSEATTAGGDVLSGDSSCCSTPGLDPTDGLPFKNGDGPANPGSPSDDRVARRWPDDFAIETPVDLEAPTLATPLLASAVDKAGDERVYWEGFFVVLPMFAGYAALFGLQHEVKTRFGLKDDNSEASQDFISAVSCLFAFNLLFRAGHNIFFGCLCTRGRVYAAMLCMMSAMFIVSVLIITMECHWFSLLILAYALGGTGVSTFECNFLSCITPLGHGTKHRCIIAIPVGISSVLVGGFFTMGPPFYLPVAYIYHSVVVALAAGMVVMYTRIPDLDIQSGATGTRPLVRRATAATFATDIGQWRKWLPQIWHYPLAGTIDTFCLACFSPGVLLYVYDKPTVEVFPGIIMATNSFFAIFNVFNMMGGLIGRGLSYRLKPKHPIRYALVDLAGVSLFFSGLPALAPLGTFLVMMGDGLIYGALAKHIDMHVPREFNLTALSYRFVLSDIGSCVGSNAIFYVRGILSPG